jgi:hypothetical protein
LSPFAVSQQPHDPYSFPIRNRQVTRGLDFSVTVRYRIHRLKESSQEHFRWTAHTGGLALVKAKDYLPGEELEAATPYAAWKALGAEQNAIRPGDLLETIGPAAEAGNLRICKFIGFEPAQWLVHEPKKDEITSETSQIPAGCELSS